MIQPASRASRLVTSDEGHSRTTVHVVHLWVRLGDREQHPDRICSVCSPSERTACSISAYALPTRFIFKRPLPAWMADQKHLVLVLPSLLRPRVPPGETPVDRGSEPGWGLMDDMWWLRHPIRPPFNPSTGAALCQMTSSNPSQYSASMHSPESLPTRDRGSMTCMAAPASEHVRSAGCLHALTHPGCGRASS